MSRNRLAAVGLVAALGLAAVAAIALSAGRGPDPDAVPTAQEVAYRTMSPFCPGQTVAECSHGESHELRAEISSKVEAGWTNHRIDDWLEANYGEAVFGKPRSAAAWVPPAAMLLLGAVLLGAALLRRSGEPQPPQAPLSPEDREILDREVQEFQDEVSE